MMYSYITTLRPVIVNTNKSSDVTLGDPSSDKTHRKKRMTQVTSKNVSLSLIICEKVNDKFNYGK